MIKTSLFRGVAEHGPVVVPLFTNPAAESVFEKLAAPDLLPEVSQYIGALRPSKDSQYVLVNAMGAGEFWGSNINGDYFPEASLIHAPDDWTGNPLLDRIRAKDWGWGYPTFYGAHPYAHHRNKDSARAFGEVELSAWNPRMKRVELVIRVDRDKCAQFGGTGVWDKLKAGGFPDVSMGCKVPFDTCSICLDWGKYKDAIAKFDPKRHKTPADAVLEVHRAIKARGSSVGIRGVSITRADYCEHAGKKMNKILPDGRKIFVYNDYPKFFDISFVFIGADKTAKVMMKIADGEDIQWTRPSVELASQLGYREDVEAMPSSSPEHVEEKTASSQNPEQKKDSLDFEVLKVAFLGKSAKDKKGEITKDVIPSQFAGKAVPALTEHEDDIPKEKLELLAKNPLEDVLSTLSMLGMVLRPREFQRLSLSNIGHKELADELDEKNITFPSTEEKEPVSLGKERFSKELASLLLPHMEHRSSFGPIVERRVIIMVGKEPTKKASAPPSSLSTNLLRKIGAAYGGYRQELMNLITEAQAVLPSSGLRGNGVEKLAHASADELFTPMSAAYLKLAFWDEVGAPETEQAMVATVERGLPSKNTNPTYFS